MSLLQKSHTALGDPRLAAMHINRLFATHVLKRIRPPTDVFAEDWDNLLILDACRHDMLEPEDIPKGRLEYRWSAGSQSEEFLAAHLDDRTLDDVVWVTANPFVSEHRDSIYEVIDVWDHGWDDELNTVPPEAMREAALDAAKRYPTKRLVVHFMQPHYPFVGEFGRSALPEHQPFTGGGVIKHEVGSASIWQQLRDGTANVDIDAVWRAYRENLELVLPIALELQDRLDGRTVLTSDHGNEVGERGFPIPIRLYGHDGGLRTANLTKVPWVVFESTERKQITASPSTEDYTVDESDLEERLRSLGYRT